MLNLRNVLFASVTLLSGVAAADRPHLVTHNDGTVEVNGKSYASTHEWLTSPEFQAAGGRCGTRDSVPSMLFVPATGTSDCTKKLTIINPAYIDGRVFVVQVVFHLIQKTDGTGLITDAQVQSQLQVLNDDYQAAANTHGAPGNNAGIKFVLARFDPMGNPTTGILHTTNDAYFSEGDAGTSAMKTALNWDAHRYLNVYSSGLDSVGLLGYATFPWDLDGSTGGGPAQDGVVLTYQSVGVNAAYTPYDLGASATHEIGHWFGLYHPFQGGCSGSATNPYAQGDLISDTPRDQMSHSGCTQTASECGDAGKFDPIENYMEYTDDSCMTKFSVEQVNRARCGIVNYRNINTEPTSLFTFASAALATTFTSTSTDAESTAAQLHYNWDFGDGMTGTDQNPVHTYAAAGSYDVTLEVVDPGSASATSKQTVVVVATGGGTGSGSGSNSGGDAGISDGGGSSGGGCCSANGGDLSFLLSGAPIAFVLLRRRRRL